MKNGEKELRKWLLYSNSKGNIFCFCCRLFSSIKISLTSSEFSDYAHTGIRLSEHESSKEHLESAYKWRILEFNIKRRTGIDHLNEDVYNEDGE